MDHHNSWFALEPLSQQTTAPTCIVKDPSTHPSWALINIIQPKRKATFQQGICWFVPEWFCQEGPFHSVHIYSTSIHT